MPEIEIKKVLRRDSAKPIVDYDPCAGQVTDSAYVLLSCRHPRCGRDAICVCGRCGPHCICELGGKARSR